MRVRLLGLGMCCLVAGAVAVAETNAPPSAAETARTQFELGMRFLQEKKYLSAAESFERATAAVPEFFEGYVNWGIALVQLGRESLNAQLQLQRFQTGAEKFSRAAELKPKEKISYLLWSETLVRVGDLPLEPQARLACYMGAAEKCRIAAGLAPDDWEIYNKWGVILTTKLVDFAPTAETRVQLCQEAAGYFAKAVELSRFSSDLGAVYANWGGTLTDQARHSTSPLARREALMGAVDKFEKSVKAIASAPATYALWGVALLELGKVNNLRTDYRAAIEKFRTSLEIRPDDPAVLYHLACAYALSDNTVLAIKTLRQCFAVDKANQFTGQAYWDENFKALRGQNEFEELCGGVRRPAAPGRGLKAR